VRSALRNQWTFFAGISDHPAQGMIQLSLYQLPYEMNHKEYEVLNSINLYIKQSFLHKQPIWFNIILFLLLVGGLFLLYNIFPVSAATISLKPAIHHYSDTHTIYFRPVGATKDKAAVDMTTLTVTKTQKKDVPATGKQEVKAIPAQGTIILSNLQGSFERPTIAARR
jgi:hypothetical protein